jgi:hypothetical protein
MISTRALCGARPRPEKNAGAYVMKSGSFLLTILLGVTAFDASAASFNGSRPLVCATMVAHACHSGIACNRSLPADLRAARLLSIDFGTIIARPARSTARLAGSKDPDQIVMDGMATHAAWTRPDSPPGSGTSLIANSRDAFALFGNCIVL